MDRTSLIISTKSLEFLLYLYYNEISLLPVSPYLYLRVKEDIAGISIYVSEQAVFKNVKKVA